MCASEIFALLLLVVVVVLLFSLLLLLLLLVFAAVVLVPSFFGDDAPFAEDILLKEISRLNSLSLAVSSSRREKTSTLLR